MSLAQPLFVFRKRDPSTTYNLSGPFHKDRTCGSDPVMWRLQDRVFGNLLLRRVLQYHLNNYPYLSE